MSGPTDFDALSIAEAIRRSAHRLASGGIASARLDAEVLLRHVLAIDRTQLLTRLREPIDRDAQLALDALIERRLTGVPVAYLTGSKEFFGRTFTVGPGVLIPRPETERLVEWALAWLETRSPARIVDVGTGSGVIALSVAAGRATRRDLIVGVDVSEVALGFAAVNRHRLGLDGAVHLLRGNLLDWCRGPIDLILANLPYLRPDQVADNPDLAAEPVEALVGGADGLGAIRQLLLDTPRVLAADGAVGLEIDPSHAEAVVRAASAVLPGARIEIIRDLAGLDRFVIADRGTAAHEPHRPQRATADIIR